MLQFHMVSPMHCDVDPRYLSSLTTVPTLSGTKYLEHKGSWDLLSPCDFVWGGEQISACNFILKWQFRHLLLHPSSPQPAEEWPRWPRWPGWGWGWWSRWGWGSRWGWWRGCQGWMSGQFLIVWLWPPTPSTDPVITGESRLIIMILIIMIFLIIRMITPLLCDLHSHHYHHHQYLHHHYHHHYGFDWCSRLILFLRY